MQLAELLIKTLTPFDCLFCGLEGIVVCDTCRKMFIKPAVSRCYRCRTATQHNRTCAGCSRSSPLRHVWVVTELDDPAKQLLYAFKFNRAQSAARELALCMASRLPPLQPSVVVVPIPTATKRLRERGYDHASLMAHALAGILGLPCEDLLVRLNQTRQVGAKREDRLKQLKGAYRLRRSSDLSGRRILLVDDVITTGATLEEASRLLKNHGAKQVGAVVFAQKR